jgi:hypothetical protein
VFFSGALGAIGGDRNPDSFPGAERFVWVGRRKFNYKNLNSVEMTKGLIFSEMTITSGMAAQQVQWVPKFQLTPFMQLIQERLDDLDGSRPDVARGKPHDEQVDEELQPDLVDLLERLDQLKKKGMLTEEEFETQRSRLLT